MVLDANVLVSAAIQRGPSHRLLRAWRSGEFELVVCPMLIEEVADVLTTRPRLRKWIDLDLAREYIEVLRGIQPVAPDPVDAGPLTRDADDDYIVWLARERIVDVIVSGDKDLIEWSAQQPPVMSPEAFERLLHSDGDDPG